MEQEQADQARLEQEQADQARLEQEQADQVRLEQEQADQAQLDQEQAEQEEDVEYFYLKSNNKQIFKAQLAPPEMTQRICHNVAMKSYEEKFIIIEVLHDASTWTALDTDVHCAGALIVWSKYRAKSILKKQDVISNSNTATNSSKTTNSNDETSSNAQENERQYGTEEERVQSYNFLEVGKSNKMVWPYEEVYLLDHTNSIVLFKAIYTPDINSVNSNGKMEFAKFQITKCCDEKWEDFDKDFHAIDNHISWRPSQVRRIIQTGTHYFLRSHTGAKLFKAQAVNCDKDCESGINSFKITYCYMQTLCNWSEYDTEKHAKGLDVEWFSEQISDEIDESRRNMQKLQSITDENDLNEYKQHIKICTRNNNCVDCLSDIPAYEHWADLARKSAAHYGNSKPVNIRRKKKSSAADRAKNKKLKNQGQAYYTRHDKFMPAKEDITMKECHQKCNKNCSENVDISDRKEINAEYWSLTEEQKRLYIIDRIEQVKPKTKTETKTPISRRQNTNNYYLVSRSVKINVCKPTFLSTLQISEKKVKVVLKNKTESCSIIGDLRGKHPPKNKLDDITVERVLEHLNSFPRTESHYCRKSSSKEYIEDSSSFNLLTLNKMYELYKEFIKERYGDDARIVSQTFYEQKFRSLNLKIHRPKKDQCQYCNREKEEKKISADEKTISSEDMKEHLKLKEEVRNLKNEYKKEAQNDPTMLVIQFDLEQTLNVPCSNVSSLYYKRKLRVYNLSVYDLGSSDGACIFWNETIAEKGSNEIASSLITYLTKIKEKKDVKKLIMFSDACGGQNRNKYISAAMFYVLSKLDIDELHHIFMVTGHSHMEVDNIHSKIENFSNNVKVFSPLEWELIAVMASKEDAYDVMSLEAEDVYDMKDLYKFLNIKNVTKTTDGNQVYWKSAKGNEDKLIHWLKYTRGESNQFQVKLNYDKEAPFLTVQTTSLKRRSEDCQAKQQRKSRKTRANTQATMANTSTRHQNEATSSDNISSYTLRIHNANGNPISQEKYNDLMKLCDAMVIPKRYHKWYKDLRVSKKD